MIIVYKLLEGNPYSAVQTERAIEKFWAYFLRGRTSGCRLLRIIFASLYIRKRKFCEFGRVYYVWMHFFTNPRHWNGTERWCLPKLYIAAQFLLFTPHPGATKQTQFNKRIIKKDRWRERLQNHIKEETPSHISHKRLTVKCMSENKETELYCC